MSLKEIDPAAMSSLSCCPRSQVKRAAKRASYERTDAYALIDRLKTAHVGFVEEGEPRIIPLTAWRLGDDLYLHSLNGGRVCKQLEAGAQLCISFAVTEEWVMSKSAYHHSANYSSLVLFGKAQRVLDATAFDEAFKAIINQLSPGRWDQVRAPNAKERKVTALFRVPIEEGAFKSRTGGPNEEPEDMALPVWHGTQAV
ncbi:pyridoxamine 5'-phosphate oxidase family protein [Marinobacter salexigens]|uniref:Pyridoxamine 5'-phosphate oxidase family protein n=1 Tax=Marinobacter salexigens TaxID=1925763 RepID=A0ABS6A721_9GAMM|nr:pyridoxamine 5'-phosphate oxidase family protein [Marinobacter salexigens]MBU2873520.1 pyridoxamine 5'-phosphate oxidase family protein [Marinobacter salexigens]